MQDLRPVDKAIKRVKEEVRKGKGVNLTQIQRDAGYTEASAVAHKVKSTKAWEEQVEPFVRRLERQRERLLQAFEQKDLTEERAKDIAKMIDTFTDNIQLLGGKATENIQYKIVEGNTVESTVDKVIDTEGSSTHTKDINRLESVSERQNSSIESKNTSNKSNTSTETPEASTKHTSKEE